MTRSVTFVVATLGFCGFLPTLASAEPLPPPPPAPPSATPEAPVLPPPASAPSEAPATAPAEPAPAAPSADALPPVPPEPSPPPMGAPPPPPPAPPGATVELDHKPAQPAAPRHTPVTRHRLFFEAAIGGGVLTGSSGGSDDVRSFSGPAISFHLLIGGSLPKGWALGAGYSRDHVPSVSARDEVIDGDEPNLSGVTFSASSFTVFADWHPNQGDGFHAQAHLGLGSLIVDRGGDGGGSESSEVAWDAIVGAGYDYRVHESLTIGGLGRVTWLVVNAHEAGGVTKVNLFVPTLLFTAAYR